MANPMLASHTIKLRPTADQEAYFRKACGVARFAYNWALGQWREQYTQGGKPSVYSLVKQLNAIKTEQFSWMLEVTKIAPQYAIHNLGRAFQNFFCRVKRGDTPGYPRFKRRGCRDSFQISDGACRGQTTVEVMGKRVRVLRLGWVRMCERVRFRGPIKKAVVYEKNGKWYVSLNIETPKSLRKPRENQGGIVGVDLGIKSFAVTSDGVFVRNPKCYTKALGRIRTHSRELSRKVKGSESWQKAKRKLARLHEKIANTRKHFLHELTFDLATTYKSVVIEDLSVKEMMQGSFARAIGDCGFYEFRRQLEYKCGWYGAELVVADRYFPSTKKCSGCEKIHDMPLSKRRMQCDCGADLDRDLNAAINLKNSAGEASVLACGAGDLALKQEVQRG